MADCYFLGIGGTGSKCVDNYVYTCSAGLGPEKLWIGMVDQDGGCGNVEKSSINIENYQRVRIGIGHPGDKSIMNSWVVKKFKPQEKVLIEKAYDSFVSVFDMICEQNISEAQKELHT